MQAFAASSLDWIEPLSFASLRLDVRQVLTHLKLRIECVEGGGVLMILFQSIIFLI